MNFHEKQVAKTSGIDEFLFIFDFENLNAIKYKLLLVSVELRAPRFHTQLIKRLLFLIKQLANIG